MVRRTAVALLLVPLFALLLQSFPLVLTLAAVGHFAAQFELTGLIHGLTRSGRWLHCVLTTLLMGYVAWQLQYGHSSGGGLLLAIVLCIVFFAVASVRTALGGGDPDAPWILLRAVALLTLPLAFVVPLALYPGSFPYLVLMVGASWAADTGAIFAGKLCGRVALATAISPRKTVEGAVCGVLTAGLMWSGALLLYPPDGALGGWLARTLPPAGALAVLFILGVFTAGLGLLGDLAFSLFKRQAHVKDYSQALPGHGGVLDRIDSVLLVIPLVYALAYGL
jgi:phosphatidate cytidylyltransferase